jgi:hypothetical protein
MTEKSVVEVRVWWRRKCAKLKRSFKAWREAWQGDHDWRPDIDFTTGEREGWFCWNCGQVNYGDSRRCSDASTRAASIN